MAAWHGSPPLSAQCLIMYSTITCTSSASSDCFIVIVYDSPLPLPSAASMQGPSVDLEGLGRQLEEAHQHVEEEASIVQVGSGLWCFLLASTLYMWYYSICVVLGCVVGRLREGRGGAARLCPHPGVRAFDAAPLAAAPSRLPPSGCRPSPLTCPRCSSWWRGRWSSWRQTQAPPCTSLTRCTCWRRCTTPTPTI